MRSRRVPQRSQQSYRHEALLWHDREDFTDTLVPFVDEGLELGEPVLVAVTNEHTHWLRAALGEPAAEQVRFVDMERLGSNPARIIPAWRDFVATPDGESRPSRGIGEPIWPGRHDEELAECQLHEAILNVAIDPAAPLWLICPYDAETLPAPVIEEAHRSHPVIVDAGEYRGSGTYGGRAHVEELFSGSLSEPGGRTRGGVYTADSMHRLVGYAKLELYVAGLSADRAARMAAATEVLARGSLRRGSTSVAIRIWSDAEAVICEVSDDAPVDDPLHGRTVPTDAHDGLWQVNQDCDLVQLRSGNESTVIRILSWR
jgi:MEDS: MEthanogen/methylotroph, DcmR Sensory domain